MIFAIGPVVASPEFYSPFSTENWLVILGFIATAVIYVAAARSGNKVLSSRLETIDGTLEDFRIELKKLTEILVVQATQNARITFMEERILQQGKRLDGQGGAVNRILFKLSMPGPISVEQMTIHGEPPGVED